MESSRMVPIATARTGFEAKVLAARLGCDGILAQFRGNVDGMYPVGEVDVLVLEDDLALARELLLADEVESAFSGDDDEPVEPPGGSWAFGAVLLLVTAGFIAVRLLLAV